MPRIQVYLPDDLYNEVKEQSLPASLLLQEAVRAETKRRALLASIDSYIDDLAAEVGDASAADTAAARALVDRINGSRAG